MFLKDGNIYEDGLAEKYDIPTQEHGVDSTEGISWMTSENAKEVEVLEKVGRARMFEVN